MQKQITRNYHRMVARCDVWIGPVPCKLNATTCAVLTPAETPKVLHRSGLCGVGLRLKAVVGFWSIKTVAMPRLPNSFISPQGPPPTIKTCVASVDMTKAKAEDLGGDFVVHDKAIRSHDPVTKPANASASQHVVSSLVVVYEIFRDVWSPSVE